MKILCVIDSLGSGGAQRQLVNLAVGFKQLGHDVSFLVYHDINFFENILESASISVNKIIEPNYFRRLIRMRRYIRSSGYDSVVSFLEAANFICEVAGLPSRKWKLVVGERSANPNIFNSIKLRAFRWFHIFADYVVANSHENIKLINKVNPLISKKKLRVIYNFVEIQSVNKQQLREKENTNIVVAASYREVKNLDGLIKAVHLLPMEYQSKLKIEWFGDINIDNSYYQNNAIKIKESGLDNIILLNDKTSEINNKYQSADFVGLFSHYEGFPNTICEAMALCKPVVVTKISDVQHFIREDVNGFLCESHDIVSIKDSLKKAINSTKEQRKLMGETNFKMANQRFNKEIIVEQYLKLLRSEL